MGRNPCCAKEGLNRGAWTAMEDKILTDYIKVHGEGKWRNLPKGAGLKRCGKSCRLRWLNYLRPDIKRGNITRDEKDLIIRLHKLLGNRWSLIAGRLPGRTDNEIKNYWNTTIGKKLRGGHIHNHEHSLISSTNSKLSPNSLAKQGNGAQFPEPSSCVVRTKASRCTRVFITDHGAPHHHQYQFTDHQQRLVDATKPEGSMDPLLATVGSGNHDLEGRSSPLISGGDNLPSHNFLVDFEMDEKFLADFLGDDFAQLCEFQDHGVKGGTDITATSLSSADPISDSNILFSDELTLPAGSDFLNPEMNWLENVPGN